jgi:hypothetical protein
MIFGFSSHFILAYWGGIGMWSFQKAKYFDFLRCCRRGRGFLIVRAQCVRGGSRNFEYWWRNNLNILTAVSILWRVRSSGRLCGRRSIFFGWQSAAATMGAANVYIYIYIFLGSSGKLSQRPQSWFDKRYLMNYWGQLGFQTCTWKAKRPLWVTDARKVILV